MRAIVLLLFAVAVLTACVSDGTSASSASDQTSPTAVSTAFAFGPPDAALPLPTPGPIADGRLGPGGGTVFGPSSVAITHGQPYRFSLGHCGLHSPVDVDESFWDEVGGVNASGLVVDLASDDEMINATSGVLIVVGDQAFFRTDSGTVVTFARHDDEKEFPGCM